MLRNIDTSPFPVYLNSSLISWYQKPTSIFQSGKKKGICAWYLTAKRQLLRQETHPIIRFNTHFGQQENVAL